MKKGLLLLLAVVMAFFGVSVKAMASARTDAMSTDVREVNDMDLIWLYPNMVLQYKNTADFRLQNNQAGLGAGGALGAPAGEWGGVISDLGDLGTVGAYVNRPNTFASPLAAFYGTAIASLVAADFNSAIPGWGNNPKNKADIFWAQNIGGADLGLHLNYGDTFNNPGTQSQDWGLSAGLGFTNVGPFSTGDIHVGYNMGSQTFPQDHGISSITAGALFEGALNTDNNIRLFADAQLDNAQIAASPAPGYSDTLALLGVAINHKVSGGKALLNTGLKINYSGTNATADEWSVIWDGGVEAQAYDWLTVRAGIAMPIFDRYYQAGASPSYKDNTLGAAGTAALGTGFTINWENWSLDTDVTVASLENTIAGVAPGRGIFFNGTILTADEADLRYKF